MKLYDITRTITPDIAVWPGDTPYSAKTVLRIAAGNPVNVTALTMSAHTGTHTDAPYHVLDSGKKINEVALDAYIGAATVVEFLNVEAALMPHHLQHIDLKQVERLLIRTPSSDFPDDRWSKTFVYPTPETAQLLADHNVKLFGTDSPTVDPLTSQTLEAHNIFCRGNVAILEGLQLRDVPPGDYELIALPLKLDGDGAPVRAVLRTL